MLVSYTEMNIVGQQVLGVICDTMKDMKGSHILLIIVLLLVAAGLYSLGTQQDLGEIQVEHGQETYHHEDSEIYTADNGLDEQRFSGTLQNVDLSCFVDGECSVLVDGKYVVLVTGWSQESVGQVIGTGDGIGGLENYLGKQVQVYAQYLDEEKYTLYGSEDYYVKVSDN